MEKYALFFLPILFAFLVLRLIVIPLRTVFRLGIHSICGLLCLWLLNTVSSFTGFFFPLNPVTVFFAGFGGLPAIAAMALLTLIT